MCRWKRDRNRRSSILETKFKLENDLSVLGRCRLIEGLAFNEWCDRSSFERCIGNLPSARIDVPS